MFSHRNARGYRMSSVARLPPVGASLALEGTQLGAPAAYLGGTNVRGAGGALTSARRTSCPSPVPTPPDTSWHWSRALQDRQLQDQCRLDLRSGSGKAGRPPAPLPLADAAPALRVHPSHRCHDSTGRSQAVRMPSVETAMARFLGVW